MCRPNQQTQVRETAKVSDKVQTDEHIWPKYDHDQVQLQCQQKTMPMPITKSTSADTRKMIKCNTA
jgi:hypothetical protein